MVWFGEIGLRLSENGRAQSGLAVIDDAMPHFLFQRERERDSELSEALEKSLRFRKLKMEVALALALKGLARATLLSSNDVVYDFDRLIFF